MYQIPLTAQFLDWFMEMPRIVSRNAGGK